MSLIIESAVAAFRQIIIGGIPLMLRQNETAFLSFMCVAAATDALSSWRYEDGRDVANGGERFARFVRDYFPPAYREHADRLYVFRCRTLHNFSPAHFTVVHARSDLHLAPSAIGDLVLDDATFYADMRAAAERYLGELAFSPDLQAKMLARLENVDRGGAIFIS